MTDREFIINMIERTNSLGIISEIDNCVEVESDFIRESISFEFNEDGSLNSIY